MRQRHLQIKKNIKYSLGKIIGAENRRIEQEVGRAEIVSFDIFDTLVKRNVKTPEDIHELVRKEYLRQTEIDLCEYRKLRINAENEARKNSQKEEINLDEIFFNLKEISEDDKSKLREIEEEIEIAVCCPDLRMKEIYERVLKAGKRIIVTSDMYLDERVIKKILLKCGYKDYEKLYLSSAYGLCKATGSIYDVIKKDYAAFQGRILHIGDHVKSDYVIPKTKGLAALLIDGQRNKLRYWNKCNKNVKNQLLYGRLYSFLNNHISDESNDAVHIACEILGPMLLGYCTWLNAKIKSDNIDKIFFLSREGKILQEAFKTLYPQSKIPQTYLYVSRQALVVPLLADANNFDEMIEILKVFLHVPVLKTIRILCGLEQKNFIEELAGLDLDEETKIYEIAGKDKAAVYHMIQKMGGDEFRKQKEFVLKYLKENDFAGNIAIVDIGWAGTMQIALQQYVEETDTVLHGYYFGVKNMESSGYYAGFHRNGYLFEPGKNNDYELMVRFSTEIFEILLLNRMGSVHRYALENNRIKPVLAEPEYIGGEGDFLESIQSTALFFLNTVKEDVLFKEDLEVTADIPMSSYSNFAVYPVMDTIKIYERFQFLNDGNVRNLLPDHGLFYYLFRMREFKQELNECFCKIFFLKKLFKINLPYFKLLTFLVTKCNVKTAFRKRYYNTQENSDKEESRQ